MPRRNATGPDADEEERLQVIAARTAYYTIALMLLAVVALAVAVLVVLFLVRDTHRPPSS